MTIFWKNNQYRDVEDPTVEQISEAIRTLDRSKWMMLQLVTRRGRIFILSSNNSRYFITYGNGRTESAILTDPLQDNTDILDFVWDTGHHQEATTRETVDLEIATKAAVYFLEYEELDPEEHWNGNVMT